MRRRREVKIFQKLQRTWTEMKSSMFVRHYSISRSEEGLPVLRFVFAIWQLSL